MMKEIHRGSTTKRRCTSAPLIAQPARNRSFGSPSAPRESLRMRAGLTRLGTIPGLERLIPGVHDPRQPIRSKYGLWHLPLHFNGQKVVLVADGVFLGAAAAKPEVLR